MKVVVFGAGGVVGRAAMEHFAGGGVEVLGVSRRPVDVVGAAHVPLDLGDDIAASEVLRNPPFDGTTNVVFAALQEGPDLAAGWFDPGLMAHNLRLFRNALQPMVAAHATSLAHVTLLQGAKAYGLHVGRNPVPAKERRPRVEHENFYFLQEDVLRELAADAGFSWTILRPQVVFGESFGSPMNLLPAIGVYAAVERRAGRPLSFPGGGRAVHEAVDARLLARAVDWASTSDAARDDIFNVTNGDVYDWHEVWPVIADACGMGVGEPSPHSLAQTMPGRAGEWAAVVDAHRLQAPRVMDRFVGASWQYADILMGAGGASRELPALLSTIKIRRAGFADCIDTEDMFREWLDRFQRRRLLPNPRQEAGP